MADTEYRKVVSADDVTDDILDAAWDRVEGWYMDSPIDWDDVLLRTENAVDIDLGTDIDSPAIRKIKKTMNQWKREAKA